MIAETGMKPHAGEGSERLRELSRIAGEFGASGIADQAAALAERVEEGRFYLACIGQFKRGKSTLLNALIGEPVLPVGVIPVTAAVTVIRHGTQSGARVRFLDGREQEIEVPDISAYVTEESNPENEKGVASVEVYAPSNLLRTGMCLVDTPGIGSIFQGNTATTRSFVPQIDAALVVLGADPPISGEELALVQDIAGRVQDLVFVLNKADRLTERERHEASAFAEKVLQERLECDAGPIYEVSTQERVTGGKATRDWTKLVDALTRMAGESRGALVESAERRGLERLSGRLLAELEEQRGALTRPIADSERRMTDLRAFLTQAGQSIGDIHFLFAAEQARFARTLDEHRDRFLAETAPDATTELEAAIARAEGRSRGALRAAAIDAAQEIAHRRMDAWRIQTAPVTESLYGQAAQRFVDFANGLLRRLVEEGHVAEAHLPQVLPPEASFRDRSHYYFSDLWSHTVRSPLLWLLDVVRPQGRYIQALRRDMGEYLHQLLFANSSRLRYDFEGRMTESRRTLERDVRSLLAELGSAAERAFENARAKRSEGEQAVQEAIEKIDRAIERVKAATAR